MRRSVGEVCVAEGSEWGEMEFGVKNTGAYESHVAHRKLSSIDTTAIEYQLYMKISRHKTHSEILTSSSSNILVS